MLFTTQYTEDAWQYLNYLYLSLPVLPVYL